MKNLNYFGHEIKFSVLRGTVLSSTIYSETHVSSRGGGGTVSVSGTAGGHISGSGYISAPTIDSEVVTNSEFWLKTDDGKEHRVSFPGRNAPVRDGHYVSVFWAESAVGEDWIGLINHSTQHTWNTGNGGDLPYYHKTNWRAKLTDLENRWQNPGEYESNWLIRALLRRYGFVALLSVLLRILFTFWAAMFGGAILSYIFGLIIGKEVAFLGGVLGFFLTLWFLYRRYKAFENSMRKSRRAKVEAEDKKLRSDFDALVAEYQAQFDANKQNSSQATPVPVPA